MKLKYYMRGLGIGMLVAALVLMLSGNAGAKMSDEAVKRRAAELGMVERDKTVLDDIDGTADEEARSEDGAAGQAGAEEPQETEPGDGAAGPKANAEEGAVKPEKAEKPEDDGAAQPVEEQSAERQPAEGQSAEEREAVQEIGERADEVAARAEEVAENSPAGRGVTLQVRSGDSSSTVARRAAEAGLVQSAADFDEFLCRNGYDKRISVGSYEVTEGMTEKEIGDIITRSR